MDCEKGGSSSSEEVVAARKTISNINLENTFENLSKQNIDHNLTVSIAPKPVVEDDEMIIGTQSAACDISVENNQDDNELNTSRST